MKPYLDLMQHVLDHGVEKGDRHRHALHRPFCHSEQPRLFEPSRANAKGRRMTPLASRQSLYCLFNYYD